MKGWVERKSGVKGEWERWRERAPVSLELGPLVANRSWQHLSLTLSPLCCCSPLIPLGARHHGKTPIPKRTHTHFHRHHTPFCVVTYPCPILGWNCPCRGPGQTSSLWNKQAANVGRQGRQLEPAHAVCEYEQAWGGGGHERTKHKCRTRHVEQRG